MLVAALIGVALFAFYTPRAHRTWVLSSGGQLTIKQYSNEDKLTELEFTGPGLHLHVAGLTVSNGEKVDLPKFRVVEDNHGLVGVLMPTRVIYIGPETLKQAGDSLPKLVLSQTLSCVIDTSTGGNWKATLNGTTTTGDELRARFIDNVHSDEDKCSEVFAGHDFVDLNGKSATATLVRSLRSFADLDSLAIEEGDLPPAIIDALRSLPRLRKLWLTYMKFDAETLRALSRLDNLSLLRLSEFDVKDVPQSDVLLDELRRSMPNTRILVADGD